MKNRKAKLIIAMGITLLTIVFLSYSQNNKKTNLYSGNINVPYERTINWNTKSKFYDSIVGMWAQKTVEYGPQKGKVDNPRILLAQLHAKTNIPETNKIILNMMPWGISGSSWALNKLGDYDFTCTVLTSILYQFGDHPELLYKETLEHLLNVLLVEDGHKFRTTAPKTLGLFPETENHILMTEGSRYLKNRWLALHGNNDPKYDNISNQMESKLIKFLHKMKTNGLHEFNSMPYIGYTITALLNLEAYASENLRKEARDVLDYMNFCYAIGSYNYKYFPPMRRRYDRANWHKLTTGYHTVFMKAWMSFLPKEKTNFNIGQGQAHALMGACMPYRPADKITKLLFNKGNGYFIKIGHGKNASPEIYAAGVNYLLSAGGVNRGKTSQIVARPITLFINDDAKSLEETFHIFGPGSNFKEWNNTGVYKNFACAAGPVSVPKGQQPIAQNKIWSIYTANENLFLAVFSSKNLGILAVFENEDPKEILLNLEKENSDLEKLKTQFKFSNGSLIIYDVYAPKNKWVIKQVDSTPLDRLYDDWPLIHGEF
ncbi:hypothetical protein APS56_07245 [Pseudalgibacter alginicilyticus]|uniref:Uncharacterized protein n=1 Tax=Pseudalgibacter alginicilyticus TaxID=1736674 RepID=A0A0P0DA91_9FLAO|nr:hypothetical protein [Pseudalgibacter alginicilyticus]ALJ04929.1 hypothetical protein APS56_07245 [Pseudalgibacter alginicilyticus]